MDGQKPASISPRDLYSAIGTSGAPLVFDVRRSAGFDADDRMLVGALRRVPGEVEQWAHDVPAGRSVVVYCQQGHEVSQEAAAALQASGIDARYLDGGIAGWAELGLSLRNKRLPGAGKWVTRERPKIDRIACPWLIRRFIDPEASFLFAPTERVFDVAGETGAVAYDIPGAEPFSHDGELCSFDAFLNSIAEQLAGLDFATAPIFVVNGLNREELIATNSMILHELFSASLGDASEPQGALHDALVRDFGSIARWTVEFSAMGKAQRGGSGWVLLIWSSRDRKLVNQWAMDHTTTLAGGQPVLALDMYEHSYHIDYGARAADYVDAFMATINWPNVAQAFSEFRQ